METVATREELTQTSERQENLEQELLRLGQRLYAALEQDITGELALTRARCVCLPWKVPLLS